MYMSNRIRMEFFKYSNNVHMFFPDLPKDGPHITGERTQYEIGDDINLNCTSGRSHPPSILQWFINDKQVKF